MTKNFALSSIAAAALLAGCTLAPHYDRPAAPVAATFPIVTDEMGTPTATPRSDGQLPAPDIGWRNFFADPQLQRLVEIALVNNRDLRVASLNVEASQAQYQIERAQLLPAFDANSSFGRTRTPRDLSPSGHATVLGDYTVGASLSWELDFFGRIRSLSNEALAQYFATAQARKAAQLLLVSQVAQQYLTVRADEAQLAVTRGTLTNAQESYRLAKVQFDNGTATALDVAEAEGVVDNAQANLAAQIRLRAQALDALVLLIGEPLPADLPPSQPLDSQSILTDIPAGLPSDLLTRRPDILQAEQNLLAQNANIGAARAAFFPQISLTGDLGTASNHLTGLFKPGSVAWSFAPQITLPIFNGGENRANLKLAEVQKNVAVAQYEKAIQTAFSEVADGLAARDTYDQQITATERFVASSQRQLNLSELLYHNGVAAYLTVLTAQNSLYAAQQQLVSARLARLANLVTLYQALGGGWIEHTGDQPRPADAPVDMPASAPAAKMSAAKTSAAS